MARKLNCFGTLLVSLWLAAVARAEPQLIAPSDRSGDEIRAVASNFFLKIAQGDTYGAGGLFAGPLDHSVLLSMEIRFSKACAATANSLSAKIDMSAEPDFEAFRQMFTTRALDQLNRPLIRNGNLATIATEGLSDTGLDLQQIDGKWKVIHLSIHYRDVTGPTDYYTNLAAMMDAVKNMVDGGQLHTAGEVAAAVRTLEGKYLRQRYEGKAAPIANVAATEPAATQPTLSVIELAALIGKPVSDPRIQRIFHSMPGLPRFVISRDTFFIQSYETGVSLSFERTEGRLQAMHIYGVGDPEFAAYRGSLPHDMKFGEARIAIERKLGAPDQISDGGSTIDASYSQLGLLVVYGRSSEKTPPDILCRLTMASPSQAPARLATQPAIAGPRLTFRLVVSDQEALAGAVDHAADPYDKAGKTILNISQDIALDESSIADVSVAADPDWRKPSGIVLKMTPAGARRLGDFTSQHIGGRIAILLDGKVLIAPKILARVSDRVWITLGETQDPHELFDLAYRLKAIIKSLPADARHD